MALYGVGSERHCLSLTVIYLQNITTIAPDPCCHIFLLLCFASSGLESRTYVNRSGSLALKTPLLSLVSSGTNDVSSTCPEGEEELGHLSFSLDTGQATALVK